MVKRSMIQHFATLVIVALFVFSVAACGGGGSTEPEATALPTLAPAAESESQENSEEEAEPEEEPTAEPEEEAAADEGDEQAEGEDAAEGDAHEEGDEHAEEGESGHMDGMMSDESMEMMTAAMEAGEAGDWELVATHLDHVIEMTSDEAHKVEMQHLLEEIQAGNTDHFGEEMQTMMDTMMGAMPKMSGTMSSEAMEMINAALDSAKAGDWETVATHMNHVLDLSTDAQQKSAVEHLLEEIEEGNTDHFIEEMEELMSAMMQVSPAMENMMAAMNAAQAGDWDTTKQEIEAAIDISTEPQEKSSLEHLLEEIDEGNAEHFVEQLEAVMQGEEASH